MDETPIWQRWYFWVGIAVVLFVLVGRGGGAARTSAETAAAADIAASDRELARLAVEERKADVSLARSLSDLRLSEARTATESFQAGEKLRQTITGELTKYAAGDRSNKTIRCPNGKPPVYDPSTGGFACGRPSTNNPNALTVGNVFKDFFGRIVGGIELPKIKL